MRNKPLNRPLEVQETNMVTANRFIEAFNTDGWDTVREVVAPDFIFHHPVGGTVQAGPEGMVGAWSVFKAALPDSWHPIPVMIAEGNYIANLLPTYGTFTKQHQNIPPTGKWLEYGMVNIARLDKGKIAEMWFGMDSLVEMQQMGVAPPTPIRQLNQTETANIELFQRTINTENKEYDNLTTFNDTVIALGPPQYAEDTTTRIVEWYRVANGSLILIRTNQFTTNPPYQGDDSFTTEESRGLAERWIKEILIDHDLKTLESMALSDILIHGTAMPCEASYYSLIGVEQWLNEQWTAFPDLSITDYFTLAKGDIVAARWTARGTSKGNFLMLPATGKTIEYTGTSMYRIEENKIAEIWETRNTLGIMMQLNPQIGGGQHSH